MSNIVGYAIGEYVRDAADDDDDDGGDKEEEEEERNFYEIVTAWIHPKYVKKIRYSTKQVGTSKYMFMVKIL